MRNTSKGKFVPTNPQKYIGTNINNITYRSSWELGVMQNVFDKHPNVLQWSSESLQIPYYNPVQRRQSIYIPDFLVVYSDKSGKSHVEMMEIKPLKETPGYQKISERTGRALKVSMETKIAQAVNAAKWQAAKAYCTQRGWHFRVVTEQTLYNMNK